MVAAMAAEMERDLIRERTLDGLRAAETQGRRGGRPAAVNDDILAIARARQSRGESVTAIAQRVTQVDPLPEGLAKKSYYEVKIDFELNAEK